MYVDNDPLVMTHARALLIGGPKCGVVDYVEADLRAPEIILAAARRTLDFTQPIAVMLVAVLHFVRDEDDPYRVVARLVDALPSGSYLVMSHVTGEGLSEKVIADAGTGPVPVSFRDREQFARFFDGLELLPPGIVSTSLWRDENEVSPRPSLTDTATYCAVGQIP